MLGGVQALRGLAALAVAAYHALQWSVGGFDVGRAGVDVFFVISGFILWRTTAGRDVPPGLFLWRRLTRIAPLYWLTTLGVAAVAAGWPLFLPEVKPGLTHLLLSLAFIPHLDPTGLPFPTLPPGWSLNYEALFYGLFALALAFPRAWRARLILGALTSIVIAGFYLPDPAYFLGANPMLMQFAAGVVLGWIAERDALPSAAAGLAMLAGAILLWGVVQTSGVFSEIMRPLLWGVPALLTAAGAVTLETRARAPSWVSGFGGPSRRLGDASYAIYLTHLPATAAVAHLLGVGRPWLFLGAAMIVSTLTGLAVHRWIERPLLRRLRAISPPAAWTTGSIRYSPPS